MSPEPGAPSLTLQHPEQDLPWASCHSSHWHPQAGPNTAQSREWLQPPPSIPRARGPASRALILRLWVTAVPKLPGQEPEVMAMLLIFAQLWTAPGGSSWGFVRLSRQAAKCHCLLRLLWGEGWARLQRTHCTWQLAGALPSLGNKA